MDPKIVAAMARPTPTMDLQPVENHYMAKAFVERLKEHITTAKKEAGAEQQLVVYYQSPAGDIALEWVSWHNPNLVILYGQDSRVLVHMANLALVLRFEPRNNAKPKPEIGFKPGQN